MTSALALPNSATPPIAKKVPKILVKHNDQRIDSYYWMKDRSNPEVLEYLKAENSFTKTTMAPTKKLQEKLIKEFRSRIKEDDSSAPYKKGDYYYFTHYKKGKEYPIFARHHKNLKNPEELLLDINKLAKGHKYYQVGRLAISYDQNHLAYVVDTVGRRFYDIYFKNLKTKKTASYVIRETSGGLVWLNDNKTILYTKQDSKTLRSYQVYKYVLGGTPELIYEENDPQYFVSVSKSLTQQEVYIYSTSNTATEVQISSADATNLHFKVLYKRESKHEYSIEDGGDRYFVLTNKKAKNFRLVEVKKNQTAQRFWREVVPHRKSVLLENVLVLQNFIVLEERAKGLTHLSYFKRGSKKRESMAFPDPTYVTSLGQNAEYHAEYFRYDYQSLTRPESVFDFDFAKNKSRLVKLAEVPGYNSNLYKSERLWAKSKDGTQIPVSVVYKKSLLRKNQNPLFVYSYGSYGLSTDSYFRKNVISLLDRGFVFATPHVRGGSEMGRVWYEDGKLLKKKNTFQDFIDSSEFLLQEGFGKKGHVYAMGGSAGGLLMGAITNMRPELYHGIIAAVPFVDVVTTMLDDSIPLTTNEYDEWGNPNDPKYYKYIKSYSPYDNVGNLAYPNILITSGFHDSQVQYWEPAKWAAKLRQYNSGPNLILLKMDMEAGHSGTTGRFQSLKEDALEYAFFLKLEEITK